MTRCLLIATLALTCATSTWAAPRLTVTNEAADLFSQVVAIPAPPEGVTALRTPDGAAVPLQQTAAGQWLTLCPGLLPGGESLRFELASGAPPTDLVVDAGADTFTIRNAFFGVSFARRGNGGLPTAIEFVQSGQVETRYQWVDRLYNPDQGQLMLWDDRDATAQVVEEGPLQVVVETRARFLKNGVAPGNNHTTYRWTFRAGSPLIALDCRVERDDDFAWSELHILQASRKDPGLRTWTGSDATLSSGPLKDDKSFRGFGHWGVLDDGANALGLGWDGRGITLYDGRSEYFTYLQLSDAFAQPTFAVTGRMYLGPALRPERYAEEIDRQVQVQAVWSQETTVSDTPTVTADEPIVLESATLKLAFEPAHFGCVSLMDKATGHQFMNPADVQPGIWRLRMKDTRTSKELDLLSSAPGPRPLWALTDDGAELRFTWTGLPLPDDDQTLDATVHVRLEHNADRAYWWIEVRNRSAVWSLSEVFFPLLTGLSRSGACDVAVPRSNWGRLSKGLAGAVGGWYPSCDWPMQFVSLHEGRSGLYLGYEDPRACTKWFYLDPGREFYFRTIAEDATRPGNSFSSPGPVAIGVAPESWWSAAKMYRAWALRQQWASQGPLTTRQSTPEACKNLGLWHCDGADSTTVTDNMRRAQDFYGVPVGMHWYSWHHWPFDTHYPDYFPAIPDFKTAIDALTPEDKIIMPYINGRLEDKVLDTWPEDRPWCTKDPEGNPYEEVYPSMAKQAIMCPYTRFWQDRLVGVCEHLIDFYGVNGIYIDQIGAAAPQVCYDPGHGHPLGGGSHWVDGYRVLLRRVQEACHRDGHDVLITTENNAEPYMDGVDCFLIWNPRMPDEIPMMTAVYSGYTLYFASNAQCDPGLLPYAMIEGRDFLYGSQPGWMGFEDAGPTERGNYLRQVVRLRHAALKYTVYGEIMGEVTPRNDVGTVTAGWRHWGGESFPATLPAVMSTLWKGSDGTLGVFIANLSPESKQFDFTLDPAQFGGVTGEGDCLLVSSIRQDKTTVPAGFSASPVLSRGEYLAPWEARVLEIRRVSSGEALLSAEASADPDLARARAEAYAAANGIQWQITPPASRVVPGDTLAAEVRAKLPVGVAAEALVTLGAAPAQTVALQPDPEAPGWSQATLSLTAPRAMQPGEHLTGSLALALAPETRLSVPLDLLAVEPCALTVEAQNPTLPAGETTTVRISLTNHYNETRGAERVLLDVPTDWDCWPGRLLRFPPVAAHATASVWVRVTPSATTPGGSQSLRAHLVTVTGSAPLQLTAPRPQTEARRLTPTLDGDLSEWEGFAPMTIASATAAGYKEYGGQADLSARMWVGADDDNLYLAAQVTDDAYSQTGRDADMWKGDCLQIDLRPGRPPLTSTMDRTIELGLALTPDGPEVWQWAPEPQVVPDARLSTRPGPGGSMFYEAAIPWSALPSVTHSAGSVAAFSWTANDSDGNAFDGWIEWTPGICGAKDASRFGLLRF